MIDPINKGMKKTTEQFIKESIAIHGNLYDYSKTVLNGMNNKVTITCPTHGDFDQRPASHTNGSGCRLCKERQRLTKTQFIDRASAKHNHKFTYDNVIYNNVKTKVRITCYIHGDFTQTPNDHLTGYGCPSCGGTKKVTTQQFIDRASKTHGGYYSYEHTTMNGMNTNVTITCPIHGDFDQRPADHVNGVGCYECSLGKRGRYCDCLLYTSPSPRDGLLSRMPSSA